MDVGSTFTKAALVAVPDGTLLATAAHPTTPPEVLDGVLACSSAGGGLRVAVVGNERLVTAEAGRRVALSAGGRVVHVHGGPLTAADVDELRAARPDVVLLAPGEEEQLGAYAAVMAADPGSLPRDPTDAEHDVRLAELAVTIALRRHGRPTTPASEPRPLRDVRLVVVGGGVLRHAGEEARRGLLAAALTDRAGGWRVPESARTTVDDRYVLFAAGLLAAEHPAAARTLVRGATMSA